MRDEWIALFENHQLEHQRALDAIHARALKLEEAERSAAKRMREARIASSDARRATENALIRIQSLHDRRLRDITESLTKGFEEEKAAARLQNENRAAAFEKTIQTLYATLDARHRHTQLLHGEVRALRRVLWATVIGAVLMVFMFLRCVASR